MNLRIVEDSVVYAIWLPLGIAVDGLLIWGMRDMAVPRTPLGVALAGFWLSILDVDIGRASRAAKISH